MSDAEYYDRFAENNAKEEKQPKRVKPIVEKSTGLSIAKVFGYMFFGLLITAGIALGLGFLFSKFLLADAATEIEDRVQETSAIILLIALVASFIGIVVLSFVVPIVALRNRRSVLVPAIIYSVLMGVMLSTLVVFIDWLILGLTFGITAVIFGLMALIALISKSRLNGLAIAAIGLFVGAGFIALTMWILMLVGVNVTLLYWIVSFAVFAAVMFITMWDMARIKTIAEKGEMNQNVSLYCAFILYNDFINIFLRLLRFIIIIFGNKK